MKKERLEKSPVERRNKALKCFFFFPLLGLMVKTEAVCRSEDICLFVYL
jgi:hypothetical protein